MFSPPLAFHGDLPGLWRRNLDSLQNACCDGFPIGSDFIQENSDPETQIQPNPKPIIGRRKKRKGSKQDVISDLKVTGLGPILIMIRSVYQQILEDLVEHPFQKEKAGILLGPTAEDDLVTHYVPDENGHATYSSFTLDAASLNRTLRHRKGVGLNCKGVVHVHPPGALHPSFGDLEYVAKLFANPKNTEATQVMLPIVADGRLYPYQIDASNPREVLVPRLILI
ncbi:hypothetical protein Pan241w_04010 [Gimesia alba]|uniref:MPN domain-containing protein n=1 Tax=Gimesia alba TaxID=2527973 RepID=A0A517R8Z5_9PLAN|nr:Mov34/MPN/PAD-1 family protein [Gimesia alba]QDT40345.1 hypothetical protein Pan241w_04010 [Gimesia alba]